MTDFNTIWQDFADAFKGALINESRKHKLTYPAVQLIFSEQVASWTSEYEAPGRWLIELSNREPEKGALVRDILLRDMHIEDLGEEGSRSRIWEYAVPLAAAGAGFGAARFLGLNALWTTCAAVAPAVVLYPVMKRTVGSADTRRDSSQIEDYVRQLDKYRNSVESALMAE